MIPLLPSLEKLYSAPYFKAKCFDLWDAHLQWLHDNGFPRALDTEDGRRLVLAPSGHEVVDLLNEYVMITGRVNAHLGLTSSDVVDNVRLIQLQRAIDRISDQLEDVSDIFYRKVSTFTGLTQGYTHWQPAAPIAWTHRIGAWVEPLLMAVQSAPEMRAKLFAGPVGDGRALRRILGDNTDIKPFDWPNLFGLAPPRNQFPIQSSDHVSELAAVNWFSTVAAQIHKIAADLRFLASRHDVLLTRPPGHAGSSSMPHKLNPYRWEKICSICRSISTTQQEMWSVAAHNGCERTLDTSWQIKHLIPRAVLGLGEALDLISTTDFTPYGSSVGYGTDSEQVLIDRVLAGESRWSAYQFMLSSVPTTNNPPATT